jgi:hypothetical protein
MKPWYFNTISVVSNNCRISGNFNAWGLFMSERVQLVVEGLILSIYYNLYSLVQFHHKSLNRVVWKCKVDKLTLDLNF